MPIRTVEELYAIIQSMSEGEIDAKIAAHQAGIKSLRKLLLFIRETPPVDDEPGPAPRKAHL